MDVYWKDSGFPGQKMSGLSEKYTSWRKAKPKTKCYIPCLLLRVFLMYYANFHLHLPAVLLSIFSEKGITKIYTVNFTLDGPLASNLPLILSSLFTKSKCLSAAVLIAQSIITLPQT